MDEVSKFYLKHKTLKYMKTLIKKLKALRVYAVSKSLKFYGLHRTC